MSPLACSLFVLAALLAAIDGHVDPYCGDVQFGPPGEGERVSARIKVHPGNVVIPILCYEYKIGRFEISSGSVTACNRPNYKPTLTRLSWLGGWRVNVECPEVVKGCDTIELQLVQYCVKDNNTLW